MSRHLSDFHGFAARFGTGHCSGTRPPGGVRESLRGVARSMSSPSLGTDLAPNGDADADASKLHVLLLAAASEVVGPSLAREVFSIARERPRRTPAGSSPPAPRTPAADFRCHAPVTLFRRLLARATRDGAPRSPSEADGVRAVPDAETEPTEEKKRRDDRLGDDETLVFADATDANDATPCAIRVVSVSSYGTVRSRSYASAEALADAVVEAADPAALGALVADVRVETIEKHVRKSKKRKSRPSKLGGELRLVTAARLRDARATDLLLCRSCGAFLQGDKGLREHCQVRHGASYEASLARVADARNALVVFERLGRGSREGAPGGTEPVRVRDALEVAPARVENETEARHRERRARDGLPLGLRLARDGRLDALRALVADAGWDPTSETSTDANGSCALHWAAGFGRLATCAFLVTELGEDPERAQKKDGRAAVHWAARNGRLKTLRWLCETRGVSADAATRDGTTPFMWCVWGGGGESDDDTTDDGIVETGDAQQNEWGTEKETQMINAPPPASDEAEEDAKNFAGALRWLVRDAKCDVHKTNAFGCNASQWAAQRRVGSVAMCAYLRDVGVDLKVTNRNGHSAVHKAAVKGNRAACEWLLGVGGLGLEHLRADGDGNTPGEMARLEGHEALAAWLAEKTRTLLEGEREGVGA